MGHFTIDTIYSWFSGSTEEKRIVYQTAKADRPRKYFIQRFSFAHFAGEVRLFDFKLGRLPSGLVDEATAALAACGHPSTVEVVNPYALEYREGSEFNVELEDDHQMGALEAMSNNKRGIIHAATNSGKTKIAEAWACLFAAKILYLVPTKELLEQTLESFRKDTNLKLGYLSAERGWEVGADVTVALASTISHAKSRKRFLEIADEFNAVIVDECHHSRSKSWRWVLKSLKKCHYRFGMSGTPWNPKDKAEGLEVRAFLGPVIYTVTNEQLISKGWSAVPKIKMIPIKSIVDTLDNSDYVDIYNKGIANSIERNSIITTIVRKMVNENKTVLIISKRLEQCDTLIDMLDELGVRYGLVIGETPKEERKKILKQLREQKIQAVISTVLGEGVDIPTLSGIVLATGEKESKQQLQRIGRGLRKKKSGDNITEIFDFIDLGHPLLAKHSRERMSIYRKEGFEIQEVEAVEFDL